MAQILARREPFTAVKPSILITGFGPFPGVEVNASGVLVARLARTARRRFPGVSVHSAILPTEWRRGLARAQGALDRMQPDIAIHFGVSPKAQGFVIEQRGVNSCQTLADGAGHLPPLDVLDAVGPKARASTLPVAAIVARLGACGLPAVVSDDAGTYLCNAVLYQTLGIRRGGLPLTAGFVHVPAVLGGDGALTFQQAVAGSLEIIAVCVETADLWPDPCFAGAIDLTPTEPS